jgi:hypothetical protein
VDGDTLPELNINEARRAMAALRAADLRTASIDELKDLLYPLFRGFIVSTVRFYPGCPVFRARLIDKPGHVRELSCPPPEVSPLGRANREGTSVFYCCSARHPTLFELMPTVGSTLVISEWQTTAPLMVNHAGYSPAAFRALGSQRSPSWSDRPIEEHGPENTEVAHFLADAFAHRVAPSEKHRYKLSVAIAEKLFAHEMFDALLYPSIAMQANSDNLALKSQYAATCLQFRRAEFARVDAVRENGFDITVLDTAVELDDSGSIRWRGRLDQWVARPGDRVMMTVENGRWVARDSYGNVIAPQ